MNALTQDRLVSVRDTAAALGCSVATVWRRAADKSIPQPVKIGGMTRWSESELVSFIEEAKAQRVAA
ncbi:helix-turn-helix domain-containing protein [Rhodobacteraceae bacterium]|nr:helix-turn-helix domain-containing protein [Paracoccaceae bacterium]